MCLELISPLAPEYLSGPAVVNDPDHYAPSQPVIKPSEEWQTVVRVSGSDNVLARCRRELGTAVTRELEGAAEEQFWAWVSDFEHSGLHRHRSVIVMYSQVHTHAVAASVARL